jgi:hypothetical protein
MTAPTPRRIVPATAPSHAHIIAGEDITQFWDAMILCASHSGRVSREEVKVGIRAHYNAPEFYEPSVQAMEGAIRFLEALGLEIEPVQEAGDA